MFKNLFNIVDISSEATQSEIDTLFSEIQKKWQMVQHRHDHIRYEEYKEKYEAIKLLKDRDKRRAHVHDIFNKNRSQLEKIIKVATANGELTEKEKRLLFEHADDIGLTTPDATVILDSYLDKNKIALVLTPGRSDKTGGKPVPIHKRGWLTRARAVVIVTFVTITAALLLTCFICSVAGNFFDLYS